MILRILALATAALFATPSVQSADPVSQDSIVIMPAGLQNGSPFLLTVALHDKASVVTGTWQGHPIVFFPNADHRTWSSLAGVDIETTPGHYPLAIEVDPTELTHRTLQQELDITEAPYEKVPLTVPDKFVEPNAAALKIIAADKIVKDKAFAQSSSKPQWTS